VLLGDVDGMVERQQEQARPDRQVSGLGGQACEQRRELEELVG